MANVSAYCQKGMLDWLLGGAAAPTIGGRFLGLSLGAPNSTNGSEASFSGYARQTLSMGAATSPAGSASNAASVNFNNSAAGAQTVIGWQIWDTGLSANSGNMLAYGLLSASTSIAAGSVLRFAVGNIGISLG